MTEKTLLSLLAVYYFALGVYLLLTPMHFYINTPGVAMMGPFNLHFIRDISFAFLTSGGALGLGAYTGNRALALAGAAWPLMHALFHLTIWYQRNLIVDTVTVSDFLAVIIPGVLVLLLAARIKEVHHA